MNPAMANGNNNNEAPAPPPAPANGLPVPDLMDAPYHEFRLRNVEEAMIALDRSVNGMKFDFSKMELQREKDRENQKIVAFAFFLVAGCFFAFMSWVLLKIG